MNLWPRLQRSALGFQFLLPRGLSVGFQWVCGGDGASSKSSALLAAWHHPRSITWRWAVYWNRGTRRLLPAIEGGYWGGKFFSPSGELSATFRLPLWLGSLSIRTQAHMWRQKGRA
jgi:hypothetical protein